MLHVLCYIVMIVTLNYGFTITPLVQLPNGEMWPPLSLAVGFIFVVRDFAQQKVGHRILLAMLAGTAISWFMAGPQVATASAAAFAVSEVADWAVYTFSRRPFSQRILLSSCLSTPLDSAVFLGMIGILSASSLVTMTASKLLGAVIVMWLVRAREKQAAVTPA